VAEVSVVSAIIVVVIIIAQRSGGWVVAELGNHRPRAKIHHRHVPADGEQYQCRGATLETNIRILKGRSRFGCR
jgi:hypothetical protein